MKSATSWARVYGYDNAWMQRAGVVPIASRWKTARGVLGWTLTFALAFGLCWVVLAMGGCG